MKGAQSLPCCIKNKVCIIQILQNIKGQQGRHSLYNLSLFGDKAIMLRNMASNSFHYLHRMNKIIKETNSSRIDMEF